MTDLVSPPALLDVIIEVPRGSFLKRGSSGQLDFISPVPCPFNYGSVPAYIGLDGDFLDAVVLGPRLPTGTRIRVAAWLAVDLIDGGKHDHKVLCSVAPIPAWKKSGVLLFFILYAKAKTLINFIKGYSGQNHCAGWLSVHTALNQATRSNQLE